MVVFLTLLPLFYQLPCYCKEGPRRRHYAWILFPFLLYIFTLCLKCHPSLPTPAPGISCPSLKPRSRVTLSQSLPCPSWADKPLTLPFPARWAAGVWPSQAPHPRAGRDCGRKTLPHIARSIPPALPDPAQWFSNFGPRVPRRSGENAEDAWALHWILMHSRPKHLTGLTSLFLLQITCKVQVGTESGPCGPGQLRVKEAGHTNLSPPFPPALQGKGGAWGVGHGSLSAHSLQARTNHVPCSLKSGWEAWGSEGLLSEHPGFLVPPCSPSPPAGGSSFCS